MAAAATASVRPDRLTLGALAAVALIDGGNATAFLALVPLLTFGHAILRVTQDDSQG